ncbi:hypothetical protein [Chitinophaga rhizosphaerae]|uniref:hypothetical protein n=1 Tax=Chitinophaga rhizosphaerae TaxID=1864947 RepID=UPI000F80FFC9|nr:hypothetical protein [Chitinophaga rhizosphaerae]
MLKLRSWLFMLILIAPVSIWGTSWYLPVQFMVALGLWGSWGYAFMRFAQNTDVPELESRLENCREAMPLWVSSLVMLVVSMLFFDPPRILSGMRIGGLMAGGSVLLVAHVYISWQIAHVLAVLSGKPEQWIGWLLAVATVLPIPIFVLGKVNIMYRQTIDQAKRRDVM